MSGYVNNLVWIRVRCDRKISPGAAASGRACCCCEEKIARATASVNVVDDRRLDGCYSSSPLRRVLISGG